MNQIVKESGSVFLGDSKEYVVTVDDPYYELIELQSSDAAF